MASSVFDLFAKLTLDSSSYDEGLVRSEEKANNFGSKLKSGLGTAAKVGAVAVAAVGTAVVATGTSLVKGAGDVAAYGDNIDKMSQKIGISAQAYQEWDAVFQHSGTSVDALQVGMKTLRTAMDDLGAATGEAVVDQQKLEQAEINYKNKILDVEKAQIAYNEAVAKHGASSSQAEKASINLTKAINNAEAAYNKLEATAEGTTPKLTDAASALLKLGVSATDSSGNLRDEEEVFAEVVTALQNMENETERTRIASLLLGRSGTELGALLNMTAEETDQMRQRVHELGGVMSDEAVKAAAAYQDSLQDMGTAFTGLKRNMLSEFLPGITTVMDGLTELFAGNNDKGLGLITSGIQSVAEKITEQIPRFANSAMQIVKAIGDAIVQNLPTLIQAGMQVITFLADALIQNLPLLIKAGFQILMSLSESITNNVGKLVESAFVVISTIADGLIQALPQLIPAIISIGITIAEKLTEPATLTQLVLAAVEIIVALANGLIQAIPRLLEVIPQIISNLVGAIVANLPVILSAGVQLLVALVTGIVGALPQLIALAPEILAALAGGIMQGINTIINVGGQIVAGFLKGISDAWNGMVENVKRFFTNFIDVIKGIFGVHSPSTVFANIGMNLIAGLLKGFSDGLSNFVKSVTEFAKNIIESIKNAWQNAKALGSNLIANIGSGISEKVSALSDAIKKIASSIGDALKRFAESAKTLGGNISLNIRNGFAEKVRDMYEIIRNMFSEIQNAFRQMIDAARSWGSGLMASFVNGIVERWNDLVSRLNQMAQAVKDRLHFTQPDKGPLSGPHGFESYAPDMMKTFAEGIKNNTSLVTDQIEKSFDFSDSMSGFESGTVVSRSNPRMVSSGPRNTTLIMQIGRTEFGRLVFEAYNEEAQRVGVKLATGGLV